MLKRQLETPWKLLVWSIVAAFGTYFCMYMFRKPFKAATYADLTLWGFAYKTILVTAQVAGYTVSKFIGIKVVSEMPPHRRALAIFVLIGFAEVALVGFGLVPAPYNLVFLFLNGLSLGMVFGLVIGFLEGRKVTEAMTAGLCVSFIVADGVATSLGETVLARLLAEGISSFWMPALAGLLFVPAMIFFAWMLSRIPAPTAADAGARSERSPLTKAERRDFFRKHAVGLCGLLLAFLLVTVLRSIRSDFAPEIWKSLGVTDRPKIYTDSETIVGIGVMLCCGLTVFVKDNRRAFFLAIRLSVAGLVLVAVSLIGLRMGQLSPLAFMVLLGIGLYLPYVTFHTTIFERLIALTRDRGNLGYLMTLADAFGYLGYVLVMLGKDFFQTGNFVRDFFDAISWVGIAGGILSFGAAALYFRNIESPERTA